MEHEVKGFNLACRNCVENVRDTCSQVMILTYADQCGFAVYPKFFTLG